MELELWKKERMEELQAEVNLIINNNNVLIIEKLKTAHKFMLIMIMTMNYIIC